MIRLEFFRYYAPREGWRDTGKSYDNIAVVAARGPEQETLFGGGQCGS